MAGDGSHWEWMSLTAEDQYDIKSFRLTFHQMYLKTSYNILIYLLKGNQSGHYISKGRYQKRDDQIGFPNDKESIDLARHRIQKDRKIFEIF